MIQRVFNDYLFHDNTRRSAVTFLATFSIPIGVCMFSNPIKHMTITAYLTTSTYTVFVTTY